MGTDTATFYGTTFTPNDATQFTTSGLIPGDSVSSVTLASSGYAATATCAGFSMRSKLPSLTRTGNSRAW